MQDLFDYLKWRGDLPIEADGFNEIDNLIFSILSYLGFDKVVPSPSSKRSVSIGDVVEGMHERDNDKTLDKEGGFFERIPALLDKIAHTKRFHQTRLSNYENQFDPERTKQFSATAFSIGKKLHYIAFRGTDDTIVGWKEDLQMSFQEEVSAQLEAAKYLKKVLGLLPGKLFLGGHSKGGNLAVFSAAKLSKIQQMRIQKIYNNDGPGFLPSLVESEGYQRILPKIITIIPQFSIVGTLLEHRESFKIVASHENGLLQHDPFSWKVLGPSFVIEDNLSETSVKMQQAIKGWLAEMSYDERGQFAEALFGIIDETGVEKMSELSNEKLHLLLSTFKTYKHQSQPIQTLLKRTFGYFFSESRHMIKESIDKEVGNILAKTGFNKTTHEHQAE